MNRVRDIDPLDMTMTAEAGVIVKAAQDAAAAAGCLFPLSFGGEGTATIGGVLSTNAGGNTTVRYGNTRELMLGLEVVLPDGQVWNGLRRLHKDNTGYCLRQLFVGSEGTLGIITAAVLKLLPAAARDRGGAVRGRLARGARSTCSTGCSSTTPAAIQAFEYMSGARGRAGAAAHSRARTLPLPRPGAGLRAGRAGDAARGRRAARAARSGARRRRWRRAIVADAVIAESGAQRAALWRLREEHSEAQKRAGASVKNDVSVPVSKVPELIRRATEVCERLVPGIRVRAVRPSRRRQHPRQPGAAGGRWTRPPSWPATTS